MKHKLVLWGSNEQDEKVLIALELKAETSKVNLYTFPEAIVSEDFMNKMMQEWRDGADVEFPTGHTSTVQELSMTETLLPATLKVERTDLINRAQTEWHFVVLSTKLSEAYKAELGDLREQVKQLSSYDGNMWNSLKGFWDKVQNQVNERNLFRDHANILRDGTNELFEELKTLRTKVNEEFTVASKSFFDEMMKKLDVVDQKIEQGGSKLHSVFEDLKALQRKYRDSKMTNDHRNAIWERLDGAFKAAKESRFGPGANDGSLVERHERRMGGLLEAIHRMEESIRRDEEDFEFQSKKIEATEGQLEAQIRQAKLRMVEDRIVSKKGKLAEMNQTRSEVERQIETAKVRETQRTEKEADRKKYEVVKENVKASIAAEAKAAADVKAPRRESLTAAATTVLGEVFEDASDSLKAVFAVVSEKASVLMEEAMEKGKEIVEEIREEMAEAKAEVSEEMAEIKEDVKEEIAEVAEDEKPEVVETKSDVLITRRIITPNTTSDI